MFCTYKESKQNSSVFQDSLVAKPNELSWFTWCHGKLGFLYFLLTVPHGLQYTVLPNALSPPSVNVISHPSCYLPISLGCILHPTLCHHVDVSSMCFPNVGIHTHTHTHTHTITDKTKIWTIPTIKAPEHRHHKYKKMIVRV